MKPPINKILIIQTAFLGDVVLATAILEKLNDYYPDADIHFLLRKGNEAVLKQHPIIKKLWILDKQRKLGSTYDVITGLRKEKFDLAVNLQRFASSGIITALSGAKLKVGFTKNPISFLFDERFDHQISPTGNQHEIDRNQQLITKYTDEIASKPRLYPTSQDFDLVKDYKRNTFITIAPASVWFTKQWPKEKWVAFLDLLPTDLQVYLLGAKGDKLLGDFLIQNSKHKMMTNLAGELSPLASAALMKDAKMNYVNDSAPMHFASSMNAPTTVIFCSTVKEFGFGPLSDNKTVIEIDQKLDCRPCGLHGHKVCPEGHFKCALEINPNSLISKK
jgi:ADP-heptose:LPS heptosyltransferase